MLQGKNILVIGARAGGYGESIARAAVDAGGRVYGTSLTPADPREIDFFSALGVTLIDIPLRYDFDHRDRVLSDLSAIAEWLRSHHVDRLDAVIHTVAGGFPRQPSVMKAVSDIIKGKSVFTDLATAVKRNVYYVNAGSFLDTVEQLSDICHDETHFVALTYRGDLPYFITPTKKYLERMAVRLAGQGKRTLIAAFPEAWTQSSQFFTGIEIAIMNNYRNTLLGRECLSLDLAPAFARMKRSLAEVEGLPTLMENLQSFLDEKWVSIGPSTDLSRLYNVVQELFESLREQRSFSILRKTVETISSFVRDACGTILVREFLSGGRYNPGDVRQAFYRDLIESRPIGTAAPLPKISAGPPVKRRWRVFEKDEIRNTLSMYGENFLFLDRVVMEDTEKYDGAIGFARFTVPTPERNPILKDHFVGIPLFGGHLQMEAVAQFGTFMILKLNKDRRLVPILTGTSFPDLNTMAPPGETLTIMGVIKVPEKRHLMLEGFIENRFARSKGTIRGMVINERLVRKMLAAFNMEHEEE
jgi:3-hydroxymyristoyl/3-hydroxydecanoyl-(acyl carrier protein) dehydratase